MPNDVIITKTQGGLGRTLPNLDHVSGIVFYNNATPTGMTVNVPKKFKSILEVEAAGIVKDDADFKFEWYQLSEYFRVQPAGEIWVLINAVPVGAYDYTELRTLQEGAEGDIRQAAIFAPGATFAVAEIAKIQAIATALETEHKPVQVIYSADTTTLSTVALLPDLKTAASPNVSAMIGQDGDNYGFSLGATKNAAIGATLGAVSKAKVNESIAWVAQFNVGTAELATPILDNGVTTLSATDKDDLDDKHYLFLRKREGITGTYFSDSYTADTALSDFNDIQLNRTMHKAIRGMRTSLLPLLHSPLKVDAGGTLSPGAVTTFKTAASKPLFDMVNNSELSDFVVAVDSTQNVLDTSKVVIEARLRPFGTARTIDVTIGYDATI